MNTTVKNQYCTSIQFISMGISYCVGLTPQVPIIKPAQKHKYNNKEYK